MKSYPDGSKHKALLAARLQEASIDCTLSLDTELRITSWNRMCETLSGRSAGAMIGHKVTEALPQVKDLPMLMQALQQALKGRKSFVPSDKGSFKGEYMESHVVPLRNEEEDIMGILVIRHDVSHRQKAENELKRLNALLNQKAVELEHRHAESVAFSKIMSHDLREPLRKINVFSDMLQSREAAHLSEEGLPLLQRLKRAALKAEAITEDLFAFSNLQQISESHQTVALDKVLRIVRHKLKHLIGKKEATLAVPPLPVVEGYNSLLQQLFHNLIENALKFSREGKAPFVTLEKGSCTGAEIAGTHMLPQARYTWVRVSDNGIGFEAQYAERIFELFERLQPPGAPAGNGVGLSLCRKIMELHHGFIKAQSTPGSGSAFTCYFPAQME